MAVIRTFLDAGVLLAAIRGGTDVCDKALSLLDDPDREFITSEFLKLELLPMAIYHSRQTEVDFYNAFFAGAKHHAEASQEIANSAFDFAKTHGIAAIDALHVAVAAKFHADEIITTEKSTKPMYRVQFSKVIPLTDSSA